MRFHTRLIFGVAILSFFLSATVLAEELEPKVVVLNPEQYSYEVEDKDSAKLSDETEKVCEGIEECPVPKAEAL